VRQDHSTGVFLQVVVHHGQGARDQDLVGLREEHVLEGPGTGLELRLRALAAGGRKQGGTMCDLRRDVKRGP
jgi:hypothetical protein